MVYKGTTFTSWEKTEQVLLVRFQINDRDHLLHSIIVISCCLNAKAGGGELMPAGEELCLLQGNQEQAFTPGMAFTQSICSQGHSEQRAYLRNHLSPEAKHQGEGQSWKMSCSMEITCLSQVTKLCSLSGNNWLTRQETWSLMPTANGNYSQTGRNKRLNQGFCLSLQKPNLYLWTCCIVRQPHNPRFTTRASNFHVSHFPSKDSTI